MKWDSTTDTADIKMIIKEYYEQLYAHKFNNLDEMDQFLKHYELLKLIQYEVDNLNNPITIKEIEFVVKNIPPKKSPGPDIFMGESYQTFKELAPILYSSRKKKLETLPNSFYEASVTMKPKPDKNSTKNRTID